MYKNVTLCWTLQLKDQEKQLQAEARQLNEMLRDREKYFTEQTNKMQQDANKVRMHSTLLPISFIHPLNRLMTSRIFLVATRTEQLARAAREVGAARSGSDERTEWRKREVGRNWTGACKARSNGGRVEEESGACATATGVWCVYNACRDNLVNYKMSTYRTGSGYIDAM